MADPKNPGVFVNVNGVLKEATVYVNNNGSLVRVKTEDI